MCESPSINEEVRTFQQLLEYLKSFGPRYRMWSKEQCSTPSDLLTQLQHDLLLQRRCVVWESEITLAEHKVFAWHIHFASTKIPWSSDPSSYFIEDLLNVSRVYSWLEQRNPKEIVAVLQPKAQRSTFLATYYQDQLGFLPEHLDDARFPVWCGYIEELVYDLNPDEQELQVSVSAGTLVSWLVLIMHIIEDVDKGLELDDGDEE